MTSSPTPVFEGVGVALVTLFDDLGAVDVPATADLAARLVDAGVRAVVVAGTTGEAATLTSEERVALLDGVRKAVDAAAPPGPSGPATDSSAATPPGPSGPATDSSAATPPGPSGPATDSSAATPPGPSGPAVVVAGTGAASARQAAALTAAAVDHGADAVLALSPPGACDVRRYYDEVTAAAGTTPVLAYHFPAVSPPGIPLAALRDLDVAGCKDSSADADRLLETVTTWHRPLFVGSSALLSLAGPIGCAGAILALANAEPERCAAAFAGDASAQRALAEAHREALVAFPAGVKRLTARRFGTSTVTRMG